LKARIISALVALAILVPCLVLWGAEAVEVLVGLILAIGLWEYARMVFPGERFAAIPLLVSGLGIYGAVLFCTAAVMHAAAVGGLLLLMVWVLAKNDEVEAAFARLTKMVFGLAWIVGLGLHIPMLAHVDMRWLVLVLLIVFAGDTGAYFSGRAFGSRKLAERVSPKKTWEGVYGGLLAAVLGTLLFAHYELPDLKAIHCVAMALLVASAGVTGDLIESLVKRACGVKDSGAIMPGHGGALDRVDSVLFGAPVMVLYMNLVL